MTGKLVWRYDNRLKADILLKSTKSTPLGGAVVAFRGFLISAFQTSSLWKRTGYWRSGR